jgi:hypothetical protein
MKTATLKDVLEIHSFKVLGDGVYEIVWAYCSGLLTNDTPLRGCHYTQNEIVRMYKTAKKYNERTATILSVALLGSHYA